MSTTPNIALQVGGYYLDPRTRNIIEIMDIDPDGNARILDIRDDIDAPWERRTATTMANTAWERIDP